MTTTEGGGGIDTSGRATPPGTVMPNIRGRLRTALPSRIRTARGQLLSLTGYLLFTPLFIALQALAGSLGKMGLSTLDLVGLTVGNVVVAAICVLASRMLLAR